MRPRLTAALLAAVLMASASAPVDDLLARARVTAREHPGIWTGATTVRDGGSLLLIAPSASVAAIVPGTATTASDQEGGAEAGTGDDLAVAFAREVEAARRHVNRVWPIAGVVVLVPGSTEEAAVLAMPAGVHGMAALADVDHVIVEPAGFARLSEVGRRVVLAHELTHVATGAAVSPDMPMWLVEGFADYVGYLGSGLTDRRVAAELAAEVRAGVLPRELPGRAAFKAGAARLAHAYEEAWLACRYVAERYGQERLIALYREARDGDPEEAMAHVLGLSTAEFTEAWRDYMRRRLVGPV
ncbi:hypothetical protein Aph01nite_13480 [Acrocarpospora phusangensis]|uniref:Peptidase MA-like domain-containing protein n=1 Tax=Acrocarpospora phusangensis TaxID=1070424 RepID=A0A919Q8X7_9ACTN|nr:hypothetical protein [Acrocarpospora phusangensis]GIH23038.1 hypothetical protein Aph01nite_13480 [Acrocarpospora phusangensis]